VGDQESTLLRLPLDDTYQPKSGLHNLPFSRHGKSKRALATWGVHLDSVFFA